MATLCCCLCSHGALQFAGCKAVTSGRGTKPSLLVADVDGTCATPAFSFSATRRVSRGHQMRQFCFNTRKRDRGRRCTSPQTRRGSGGNRLAPACTAHIKCMHHAMPTCTTFTICTIRCYHAPFRPRHAPPTGPPAQPASHSERQPLACQSGWPSTWTYSSKMRNDS